MRSLAYEGVLIASASDMKTVRRALMRNTSRKAGGRNESIKVDSDTADEPAGIVAGSRNA
jgi:hypothetical protein